MKGFFTFQFVIAGMLFFIIILLLINQMRADMSNVSNIHYRERLAAKAVQISSVLMSSNENGLLERYPVFDEGKVKNFFESPPCDPYNHSKMNERFGIDEERYYGTRTHHLNIYLSTNNGDFNCAEREPPKNVAKAEVVRYGVYDEKNATLRVVLW